MPKMCTEKEKETCNVEKMGCEGCAYNKKITLEEALNAFYELKKYKKLIANIDKDFFLNFAELLFSELDKKEKELEEAKRETQQVLDDYQDLGKEKYKLECELDKKEAVINEMAKDMCGLAIGINEEYQVEEYLLNEETIKEYYEKVEEGK